MLFEDARLVQLSQTRKPQEGKFIVRLIDGSTPSYQTLLQVAKDTDSLRVVDGEIDNKYDPKAKPIRFSK